MVAATATVKVVELWRCGTRLQFLGLATALRVSVRLPQSVPQQDGYSAVPRCLFFDDGEGAWSDESVPGDNSSLTADTPAPGDEAGTVACLTTRGGSFTAVYELVEDDTTTTTTLPPRVAPEKEEADILPLVLGISAGVVCCCCCIGVCEAWRRKRKKSSRVSAYESGDDDESDEGAKQEVFVPSHRAPGDDEFLPEPSLPPPALINYSSATCNLRCAGEVGESLGAGDFVVKAQQWKSPQVDFIEEVNDVVQARRRALAEALQPGGADGSPWLRPPSTGPLPLAPQPPSPLSLYTPAASSARWRDLRTTLS